MHSSPPPDIEGADVVTQWFGGWPCFHDSEILQCRINRGGISDLRIDLTGYPAPKPRGVLIFEFSGITSLHIEGEDADVQNVISDLDIAKSEVGYRLRWGTLFGLAGEMEVRTLRVRLEPHLCTLDRS